MEEICNYLTLTDQQAAVIKGKISTLEAAQTQREILEKKYNDLAATYKLIQELDAEIRALIKTDEKFYYEDDKLKAYAQVREPVEIEWDTDKMRSEKWFDAVAQTTINEGVFKALVKAGAIKTPAIYYTEKKKKSWRVS